MSASMNERWRQFGTAVDAAMAVAASSMTKFADELAEATKRRPEKDYWRGYTDAMQDMEARDDSRPL